MASIFQIDISRNTKCALKDGFRKSSHNLVFEILALIKFMIQELIIRLFGGLVCGMHA